MYADPVMAALEAAKRMTRGNVEYWTGRAIQPLLGYASWDKFTNVIRKAIMACESAGVEPKDHFSQTGNMVEIGSGAKREESNYFLSRYACYLVAMSGDTTKPEVAAAQTYFAVQTRRQEIQDQKERLLSDTQKRIELRDRLKDATKHLNSAAKQAGVQSYALFAHAGYMGLYGMPLSEIKTKKSIPESENLFDCAGRAELAMNEFRATQTEQSLIRNNIRGEQAANREHERIGQEVRNTVKKLSGTMPENLPAEPSLKKLTSKRSKHLSPPSDR
jgi:DNA-damage-inducible protein D